MAVTTSGVDDVFARDRALFGDDLPVARFTPGRQCIHLDDPVPADDLGAGRACEVCECHRDAARVDMALASGPDRPDHAGHVKEGVDLLCFEATDQFDRVSENAADAEVSLELVEFEVVEGEA